MLLNNLRNARTRTRAAALALAVLLATAGMAAYRAHPPESNTAPLADDMVAPLLAFDRALENVAQRVTPAVVNISAVARAEAADMQQDEAPGVFGQFFGPQRGPGAVEHVGGSGVIISPDGYIVTNNHVVNGASDIRVTLNDRREFPGLIVGTDPLTDLAVVKIAGTGLPNAPWGDSRQLKPGETVLAFGNPLGMQFTVTRGIISALNRPRLSNDPRARGSFIQTDAAINFGNSGGPLVNVRGEVIGIDTAMYTTSGASAGIGFAIPSNLARSVASQLSTHGKVVRGYIGVSATDISPAVRESLRLPDTRGALVNQVEDNGPAASGGVRVYDVITRVNSSPVASADELQAAVGEIAPGSSAHFEVLRDGKPQKLTVKIGQLGDDRVKGRGRDEVSAAGVRLGVQVTDLTAELRDQLGLPASVHGVVICAVEPGRAADNAGLSRGDLITEVNRHPVHNVAELRQQVRASGKGSDVMLLVYSRGGSRIVVVHPGE